MHIECCFFKKLLIVFLSVFILMNYVTSEELKTKYGSLKVVGNQLCDSAGKPVQLKGMSTMGLQWYGGIVNADAFKALSKDWGCDLIRLAFYIGENGYAKNPDLKKIVLKGIDLAIQNGMYVIVDWHVLTPGNPNDPIYSGAVDFFKEIAGKYAKYPNIIYEIANEPNGNITWEKDVKPYSEKLVSAIRAIDPNNVILIGTTTWSQDVDIAAGSPVKGSNLMYAVHFYSGTHGKELRDKVQKALDSGVAVFCSECGTSESNGNGGPYIDRMNEWFKFFDEKKISWVNWSLCNKIETSAAFKGLIQEFVKGKGNVVIQKDTPLVPSTNGPDGYKIWTKDELTESGVYIRAMIKGTVAFDNIALSKKDDGDKGNVKPVIETDDPGIFKSLPWDFNDQSRQGWYVTADSPAKVKLQIKNVETSAIGFDYAWTIPSPADTWSVAPRISSSAINIPGKDFKSLSFDFIIEEAKAKKGLLQVHPVIQSPQHGFWFQLNFVDIEFSKGKKIGGGLLKYTLTIPIKSNSGDSLKPDAVIRNLVLITAGVNTDYQGSIFYDNITFNK